MIGLELLVISLGSRNTSVENMERRNGNVTSVPRSMLFNLIGKLIQRLVAQKNTDVTVELSSPGNSITFTITIIFIIIIIFINCRRDSFITHRAFCDALAEESARVISTNSMEINHLHHNHNHNQFMNGFQDILPLKMRQDLPPWLMQTTASSNIPFQNSLFSTRSEHHETSEGYTTNNRSNQSSLPDLPPALLQKTTTTTTTTGHSPSQQTISGLFGHGGLISSSSSTQESTGGSTGGGNGYVHDMMLPSLPTSSTEAAAASGLYVSYEDAAAINIHERKKDHGLTRDLLGLRAFSHNDILNMVGLDPIPNTSTSSSYHHHPQNPWLG